MKVLTALDGSEYAEIVLEHGLDQAARSGATELHFATVVGDDADADGARAWLRATVREGIEAFGLGDRTIELHVRRGRPATAIATLARDLSPDLLVIGRFAVPSESDAVIDTVDCPTLVVGIEGHVLEPQCDACKAVRQDTRGERLFCDRHLSDRVPNLVTRVPPSTQIGSRMW